MAASNPEGSRGLTNQAGEHNCFLNTVIQSLWQVEPFRRKLLETTNHNCSPNCIFCAMKTIFTNYAFSDEPTIIPDILRQALSGVFAKEKRFQQGHMDDASECMTEVLNCIITAVTSDVDKADIQYIFQLDVAEQINCAACNSASELKTVQTFVPFFYVAPLRSLANTRRFNRFDDLLGEVNKQDRFKCVNEKCTSTACTKWTLLVNKPSILSLQLVWTQVSEQSNTYSVEPTIRDQIGEVLNMIDQEIDLTRIFESQEYPPKAIKYQFRGMICFYAAHYLACFWVPQHRKWMSFDDSWIKVLGNTWDDVKDWCKRNTYRPYLLLYEHLGQPPPNRPFRPPVQDPPPAKKPKIDDVPSIGGKYPKLDDLINFVRGAPPPLPPKPVVPRPVGVSAPSYDVATSTAPSLDTNHHPHPHPPASHHHQPPVSHHQPPAPYYQSPHHHSPAAQVVYHQPSFHPGFLPPSQSAPPAWSYPSAPAVTSPVNHVLNAPAATAPIAQPPAFVQPPHPGPVQLPPQGGFLHTDFYDHI